nr:hypothetical protein [Tanacetum cinerariifolium]
VYPEYIPPEDDVFPAEEQPLPAAASPTAESPGYIPEADRPEVTLPPRKRLSIVHFLGYEAGESSVAVVARSIKGHRADYGFVNSVEAEIRRRRAEDIGYGIRDTWIDPRDVAEEEALTTLEGVNSRVTELVAVQEQDTQDIYGVMEDTQGHIDSDPDHTVFFTTGTSECFRLESRLMQVLLRVPVVVLRLSLYVVLVAIFCKPAKYYGFYPQLADSIYLLFWLAIMYGSFSSD